jgi:hypothetical protein
MQSDNTTLDFIRRHYPKHHRYWIADALSVPVRRIGDALRSSKLEVPPSQEYATLVQQYRKAVEEGGDLDVLAEKEHMTKKTLQWVLAPVLCPPLDGKTLSALLKDYTKGLHRFELAHKYSRTPEYIVSLLRSRKLLKPKEVEFADVVQAYLASPCPLAELEAREHFGVGQAWKILNSLGVSGALLKKAKQ